MEPDNIIPIREDLEKRITKLEIRLESAGKPSISSILKAGWILTVAIVAATVFLVSNIYDKASAETVQRQGEILSAQAIKIENEEARVRWLTRATYEIAKAMGLTLDPPP